jgi:group I intron endonuclease
MKIDGEVYHFTDPFPIYLSCISGVYRVTNKNSGEFYIGSCTNFYKRFYRHRAELRHKCHRNCRLEESFHRRGGDEAFIAEVIEQCPRRELLDREQHHLDFVKLDPLCTNILLDTRRGIGKTHPEWVKKKIRVKCVEYWSHPQNRAHASKMLTGKKRTPEMIVHVVKAHSMPFRLRSPSGLIFEGINRAKFARDNGLDPNKIHAVIHGLRKHHLGWTIVS